MDNAIFDGEQRISQYVQLRDKIKAINDHNDAALKPYKDALETLGNLILKHLNDNGIVSVKATSGTAYVSVRESASLMDSKSFFDYVLENKAYELLDIKGNVTAISDFVDANGVLPPGAKLSKLVKIGVRRSGEKE